MSSVISSMCFLSLRVMTVTHVGSVFSSSCPSSRVMTGTHVGSVFSPSCPSSRVMTGTHVGSVFSSSCPFSRVMTGTHVGSVVCFSSRSSFVILSRSILYGLARLGVHLILVIYINGISFLSFLQMYILDSSYFAFEWLFTHASSFLHVLSNGVHELSLHIIWETALLSPCMVQCICTGVLGIF